MWSEHTLSLMARFRYCLVAQAEIKHMPAMESASFKYQLLMSLPAGLSAGSRRISSKLTGLTCIKVKVTEHWSMLHLPDRWEFNRR